MKEETARSDAILGRWLRPVSVVLLLVGTIAAFLFLLGHETNNYGMRMASKPIPVLCMASWLALRSSKTHYAQLVLVGLLLGMTGDILLEASSETFLLGLVAFLMGHVAYIIAFWRADQRSAPLIAIACYAYGALIYALLLWRGELGDMALPVALYVIVICTMLWRAAARVTGGKRRESAIIAGLLGALLFTVSDTLLALDRFETGFQAGRHTVIITYWLGQLGITLSARKPSFLA